MKKAIGVIAALGLACVSVMLGSQLSAAGNPGLAYTAIAGFFAGGVITMQVITACRERSFWKLLGWAVIIQAVMLNAAGNLIVSWRGTSDLKGVTLTLTSPWELSMLGIATAAYFSGFLWYLTFRKRQPAVVAGGKEEG
jgi:hypothetical protein